MEGLGFGVMGLGWVQGYGFRVQDSGLRVYGLGFGVGDVFRNLVAWRGVVLWVLVFFFVCGFKV